MTYRYSVLYFLNLSVKQFFPHRKRQFLWKYPNPETVIVPCFNVSRMPNRRTSQSKYIVSASVSQIKRNLPFLLLCVSTGKQRSDRPDPPSPKQILRTKHIYNKIKRTTIWFCGWGGGGGWQFMSGQGQNIYFQSFAGDNIYFHQTIYYKI